MKNKTLILALLALAGCAYDTSTVTKPGGVHEITISETAAGGGGNALDWQTKHTATELCGANWSQVPPASRRTVNGRDVFTINIKCE